MAYVSTNVLNCQRAHLRALAQRFEVADDKIRIGAAKGQSRAQVLFTRRLATVNGGVLFKANSPETISCGLVVVADAGS